jgi:hypothetical protein
MGAAREGTSGRHGRCALRLANREDALAGMVSVARAGQSGTARYRSLPLVSAAEGLHEHTSQRGTDEVKTPAFKDGQRWTKWVTSGIEKYAQFAAGLALSYW